ncbi:MAG: prepilin peptidase [Candidatus Micropelagos thuwalensis]
MVEFIMNSILDIFSALNITIFDNQVSFIYLPFIVICLVIFITDFIALYIPDSLSLGGILIGLLFVVYQHPALPSIQEALLGGSIGFFMLYLINLTYRFLRGVDGIGGGDFKLMAMIGVWMGPNILLPTLFIASIFGTVIGFFYTLRQIFICKSHRKIYDNFRELRVPFGCLLISALFFNYFFGINSLYFFIK